MTGGYTPPPPMTQHALAGRLPTLTGILPQLTCSQASPAVTLIARWLDAQGLRPGIYDGPDAIRAAFKAEVARRYRLQPVSFTVHLHDLGPGDRQPRLYFELCTTSMGDLPMGWLNETHIPDAWRHEIYRRTSQIITSIYPCMDFRTITEEIENHFWGGAETDEDAIAELASMGYINDPYDAEALREEGILLPSEWHAMWPRWVQPDPIPGPPLPAAIAKTLAGFEARRKALQDASWFSEDAVENLGREERAMIPPLLFAPLPPESYRAIDAIGQYGMETDFINEAVLLEVDSVETLDAAIRLGETALAITHDVFRFLQVPPSCLGGSSPEPQPPTDVPTTAAADGSAATSPDTRIAAP